MSYSLVEEQPLELIGSPDAADSEAASQHQVDMQVRSVIDRALALKKRPKFEGNPNDKG